MAAEAPILDEFRRLRARVPQLTGALAAGVDGLVIAHDTPGVEPDGLAALTAAALGVAVRMTDATGRGDLRELLVRGTDGYVATYAAGRTAVLTLLAARRQRRPAASGGPPGRCPHRGARRRGGAARAQEPGQELRQGARQTHAHSHEDRAFRTHHRQRAHH